MDTFFTSSGLLALITLTFLEIVLGVDNVIFISILSSKLPASQQGRARRLGLLAAMGMRILLLLSIVWIIRLTAPLFYILGRPISGRDLILIGGGLFLLAKATIEIHEAFGGRGRPQLGASATVVCRRHYSDHGPGHRLFAGFSHYRGRHGRPSQYHGSRRGPGRRCDVVLGGAH